MPKLRKLLTLTIVAATLAAQPEAARAAGEILSQGSAPSAPVIPQLPASPIGALPGSGLGGLQIQALPGGGSAAAGVSLKGAAGLASGAQAPAAAAPAGARAELSTNSPRGENGDNAQPAATPPVPAAAAAARADGSSLSHDSLVSRSSRLAARRQPGEENQAGQPAQQSDEQRPADAGRAAFDGDLRVFLTAHGRQPVEASINDLPALLAADPAYAKALNEHGLVRLAIAAKGGALGASALPAVEAALRERGVTAKLSLEKVPGQPRPDFAVTARAGEGGAAPATLGAKISRLIAAPVRELGYLARSFGASLTKPTSEEVLGGVVSKGPAFGLSVVWWMSVFMPAKLLAFAATPVGERVVHLLHMTLPATTAASHPVHFALAVGGSLALEAFHGLWINTWQNFQKILGQQRGVNYQAAFNFLYMQASAAAFRILTWTVVAGTIAPWTLHYWRDMGVSSVFGTFFGVLGFFGLNTLYDKGRISRRARSWLQQGRDLFFLLAGTFLFSGSMHVFWALWATQQLLDISLYVISRRAAARPTLYVAEPAVASSEGFKSMYPVTPGERPSPLQQAIGAVLGNPFVKPLAALGKWAWKKARGMARK